MWHDLFIFDSRNLPCEMGGHVTYEGVKSHVNESCHIWMSHVTHATLKLFSKAWLRRARHVKYEWVMAHTIHSRVTCERVMSHMNTSCPIWMSQSCPIWMSHGTYDTLSCHIRTSHVTYEYVVSHMNESVMSHMNESCHIWMSHVTHEWVMSHMNESWHRWPYAQVIQQGLVASSTACRICYCATPANAKVRAVAQCCWRLEGVTPFATADVQLRQVLRCRLLQSVAMRCRVLQSVAECCSVLPRSVVMRAVSMVMQCCRRLETVSTCATPHMQFCPIMHSN